MSKTTEIPSPSIDFKLATKNLGNTMHNGIAEGIENNKENK